MTASLCVICGRPMADQAYVCQADALSLAETLVAAAGHAEDAEAVIARQARYGGGGRGGQDEPLPVDLTKSKRLTDISLTAGKWGQRILDSGTAPEPQSWRPVAGPPCSPQRPGDKPRDTRRKEPWYRCEHDSCAAIRDRTTPSALTSTLRWLAAQTGLLRKHPDAKTAFADLDDACRQLARLVDRPPDQQLVGMCDCGRTLYAPPGRTVVTCPEATCRLTWNVAESRDILRRSLDGKLVTAAEAARLGSYLDTDRNQEQIRNLINKWSSRRQVLAHGEIDGKPTFRFGDISDRLARTPRRAARAAESEEAA